jgi:hypothetical protein
MRTLYVLLVIAAINVATCKLARECAGITLDDTSISMILKLCRGEYGLCLSIVNHFERVSHEMHSPMVGPLSLLYMDTAGLCGRDIETVYKHICLEDFDCFYVVVVAMNLDQAIHADMADRLKRWYDERTAWWGSTFIPDSPEPEPDITLRYPRLMECLLLARRHLGDAFCPECERKWEPASVAVNVATFVVHAVLALLWLLVLCTLLSCRKYFT